MPKVLVVSGADLSRELGQTVLWRNEVERSFASDPQSGFEAARSIAPNLIVLDGALPDAVPAIRRLREDPATRPTAIVVVSRDDFLGDAEALRAAGANAVVPPEADPLIWDARLEDLLSVPRRREARIPARLEMWSRVGAEGDVVEGSALNISVHGLLLESARPLEVGAKLDVRFTLPGCDDELKAVGEVVRQDARPRSGIKFLVLRGEAREAIHAFVECGVAGSSSGEAGGPAARPSEGREWEAVLRASEALKAAILETAPDSVVIMNHEGRIVEINRAAERTLGYSRDQLVGRPVAETIAPPPGEDPHRRALAHHLATGGGSLLGRRIEMTVKRADGFDMPVELTIAATPVMGRPLYTAFVRDLSAAKRAEGLKAAAHRITEAAGATEDVHDLCTAIHGIVGELMYARNFFIALRDESSGLLSFPYFIDQADATPPEATGGKTLTDHLLRTGEALLASPSVFADLLARGDVETVRIPSVEWLGVPLKKHGQAFGVVAVQSYDPAIRFTDDDRESLTFVSQPVAVALERKQAEARIQYLAYHDAVTGLPNRHLLLDRLQLAIAQAARDQNHLAVLFLNLDRFKVINDSLGHTVGDQVLKEAASRLQRPVRKGDTLACIGGDEFTILVRGLRDPADAAKVAQSLQAALGEPLLIGERELFVTASIGISAFPDDGTDVETLLKNADTALHRAKEKGHDSFCLYDPSMNAQAVQRLRLEHGLRRALSRDELVTYYQPVVDLTTGEIHCVEALLRWRHPERGLVLPGEFIHLAETTGVIRSIGSWGLRTACAQTRAWQEQGHPRLSVAVNLSARQLQHMNLVAEVTNALEEAGLAPAFLELEITESSAMQNAETTIRALAALKSLGVRISIDDFGVGYSSLSQLQRLPIDTLKIDQTFVRDIRTDTDDAAIAAAIIRLGHTLKLSVVAEGVETPEQLAFLAEQNCDRIQGYLLAHPVPAEECAVLLAGHQAGKWRARGEPAS